MLLDYGPLGAVRDFLLAGGPVVWALLVAAVMLWSLIIERLIFVFTKYPQIKKSALQRWDDWEDHSSWYGKGVRSMLISEASRSVAEWVQVIKTIVALCPLLGLLGTVTGMISVFDVMAISGTGDARQMASGVFRATLPTMAGMVVALSGIYFSAQLETLARRERRVLEDELGSH